MEITRSTFTVSELRDARDRKELVINRNYQRSASVWPENARSYLIDTILNGYLIPKVFFYEVYDRTRKKIVREIVDGQQRISSILDFSNDQLKLDSKSEKYSGQTFSTLDDDSQQRFMTYVIEVDIIRGAEHSDLLAMFTRMNAYTAPLNSAEKRHAQFEGAFKWFILRLCEKHSATLVGTKAITSKQAIRMVDAEFFTELCIALRSGITDKSEKSMVAIYKDLDSEFPDEREYKNKIDEFMEIISINLVELHDTFITKPYVLHSLFCALMQRKYGIPNGEKTGIQTVGSFFGDAKQALSALEALAGAHEAQDTKGQYAEYVVASLSTTHRVRQRTTRTDWLGRALG